MSDRPFDIVVNGTRETIELRLLGDTGKPFASLDMSIGGALALSDELRRAANAAAGLVTNDRPTATAHNVCPMCRRMFSGFSALEVHVRKKTCLRNLDHARPTDTQEKKP